MLTGNITLLTEYTDEEREWEPMTHIILDLHNIAPVMRYEMTLVHVLMFISFLNLTSINIVRTN